MRIAAITMKTHITMVKMAMRSTHGRVLVRLSIMLRVIAADAAAVGRCERSDRGGR